ncbi:N-6 DNA methylase [Bacillus sp. Bos-x628]|uniref:HsdM family class I SAM-dependent methyltransferase n=1 Tax=Bacillus maqinnsis TaxID=3229854 RepID=UPI00338E4868
MGKAGRKRWDGNVKSMEILAKPIDDITTEEVDFLRNNYTSSGGLIPNAYSRGAIFTPPNVSKFMWDVLASKLPKNPRVLEPSAGAGVFLEHAPKSASITALELDKTSAKVISILYPAAEVIEGDALIHDRRAYYDLVIGNPPYGVSVEFEAPKDEVWSSVSKTKNKYRGKSEVAFIELAIKSVKPGGYIAFILPLGISYTTYAKKLRKLMHETCWQIATIMLPSETFQHVGTKVATQIIIIRKAPPGTKLISPVTTKWGSNFRKGGFKDISDFDAKFLEGQTPAYFSSVKDIGWNHKGEVTDSNQLDELLDDFTDGNLMRENLYPHIPSWYGIEKSNDAFFFSHGNDTCDGLMDAKRTFSDGPLRWNELTLGAGEEVLWNGEPVSTFDFDWQECIVDRYYATKKEAV